MCSGINSFPLVEGVSQEFLGRKESKSLILFWFFCIHGVVLQNTYCVEPFQCIFWPFFFSRYQPSVLLFSSSHFSPSTSRDSREKDFLASVLPFLHSREMGFFRAPILIHFWSDGAQRLIVVGESGRHAVQCVHLLYFFKAYNETEIATDPTLTLVK